MTAMTATTLDQLSGGRFLLGLGVSGPQVVEGWHGVPYGKPLVRTREYVEIVRQIWAREKPLEHQGEHYQIPYRGAGATGLGKPLKSILHGRQIPIYLAAIGPKSVEQAAEIADGWLPIFFSPYRTHGLQGRARSRLQARPATARACTTSTSRRRSRSSSATTCRLPQLHQAGARPLHRRHGRARQELLQRPRLPLRLRGRGEEDPGPLPRRQEGRGGRRGARRSSPTRSRWSARRSASATGSPPGASAGVTTMICGIMQIEAVRALAEIGA